MWYDNERINKKFRLYLKQSNTMIELNNLNEINLYSNTENILLQYINLFDKTNKEICEGDIIKLNNELYVLTYWLGSFSMTSFDINCINHWTFSDFDSDEHSEFLIIGNVFQNKELLGERK